jgi:hypothetical protein
MQSVELNHEQAGSIVAQVLKEDFDFISKEISELSFKGDIDHVVQRNLKPHEYEDLRNNIEMRDAMKSLLRYYLTHNDYTEFMELQRVYGNVE